MEQEQPCSRFPTFVFNVPVHPLPLQTKHKTNKERKAVFPQNLCLVHMHSSHCTCRHSHTVHTVTSHILHYECVLYALSDETSQDLFIVGRQNCSIFDVALYAQSLSYQRKQNAARCVYSLQHETY